MAVVAERLHRPSDGQGGFEAMFAVWRELDPPMRYRAEIIGGLIVMTPPPGGAHNAIEWFVHRALVSVVGPNIGLFPTVAVKIAGAERVYEPDLVVAPVAAVLDRESILDPADVLLILEVTSPSTARSDRGDKLRSFARGDVPAYLLVDRVAKPPVVTLFTDPVDGHYTQVVTALFGESLHLPEPFDVDLDTSQFPR